MPPRSFSTLAVHAGERLPAGRTTPVVTPIYPSVGTLYENMTEADAVLGAQAPGYIYPRYGSPTVAAFETAVAALEGAESAHAFASGMAALHVSLLAAGVNAERGVVAAADLYGATYTLVTRLLAEQGVPVRLVDVTDLDGVEAALREIRPAALLVETISNPLLKVADVPGLARLAAQYGSQLLVDNTFATPFLFNPLAHGAAFAIHSATKYLGGHGDLLAGVAATTAEKRARMYELNKLVGSVLGPFDAWLALRGIKTLPLRVERQCQNALRIASYLNAHPQIEQVHYPGLSSHPQHALAQRLFGERGYGGVLSFVIRGAGQAEAFRFMEHLRLCLPATTLGDVYTLILHPATASHRSLSPEQRQAVGIPDGLLRLSAGIEGVEDILEDLEQALGKI